MLTVEELEDLGFEYKGKVKGDGFSQYHMFLKDWTDCCPDCYCSDHFYGSHRIHLPTSNSDNIIVQREKLGGFMGMNQITTIYDGDCPDIETLKLLIKLLKIKNIVVA